MFNGDFLHFLQHQWAKVDTAVVNTHGSLWSFINLYRLLWPQEGRLRDCAGSFLTWKSQIYVGSPWKAQSVWCWIYTNPVFRVIRVHKHSGLPSSLLSPSTAQSDSPLLQSWCVCTKVNPPEPSTTMGRMSSVQEPKAVRGKTQLWLPSRLEKPKQTQHNKSHDCVINPH